MKALFILILFSPSLWAQSAAETVQGYLDQVVSMQARFEQTVQGAVMGAAGTSSGQFYLQKPGLMRWEYNSPKEKLILADGRYVWVHDPELDQVTQIGQKRALKGTPGLVLTGDSRVQESFSVSLLVEDEFLQWFRLTPLVEGAEFSVIDLGFAQGGKIDTLRLKDEFGQTTYITLTDIRVNQGIDAGLFKFTPPSEADVFTE